MNDTFEPVEPFGAWDGHNALSPDPDDGSNRLDPGPSDAFEARGSKGYGQRDVTPSGATPFDPHRNGVLQHPHGRELPDRR
jgi:hypothetical protein